MSPEVPAGLSTKAAADPVAVRPKPLMTPREAPKMEGGHSASTSLARKFDGAVERPHIEGKKKDTPVMETAISGKPGAGADWSGMPRLSERSAPQRPEAPEGGSPLADEARGRGASVTPHGQSAYTTATAKPAAEDYSYTYLAPARHSYEFPNEKPPRPGDTAGRMMLDYGLRLSAAGAVGYLLLYSNLPYILGLSRRRRRE